MGSKSKDAIKTMVGQDLLDIYNRSLETRKAANDSLKNVLEFLHTMIAQIPNSTNGPLIPKTPKAVKKKGIQRIETIPEDDVVDYPRESVTIKQEFNDTASIRPSGRVKREASKKAENNIRKQQSLNLHHKLRRPASNEFDSETKTKKRESRAKRKKSSRESSDEDNNGPAKHSRTEETITTSDTEKHYTIANETVVLEQKEESPVKLRKSDRQRSASIQEVANNKTYNMGDDTLIAPVRDDIEEPSMYEEAMCKPVPIMNSTMNLNGPTVHNMMNATVVLEPLPNANLNMTVTIQKKPSRGSKNTELETQQKKSLQTTSKKSPRNSASSSTGKTLPDKKQEQILPIINNIDDLLTDDESSPEIKKTKYTFKKPEDKKKRRKVTQVHSSSDDDSITPPRKIMRAVKNGNAAQDVKNGYKPNALFSPYAKESVKKRVEAFEQAGLNSPKAAVDVNAPTRLTRTKTRALAAAQAEAGKNVDEKEKSITQKLARKSLAKAKKISLAKEFKDIDDYKENLLQSVPKPNRLVSNDKASSKQSQKTTPLGKTKTLLPMSVNRLQHTPSNHHIPHTKALSATRSNIVTNMDSFLQHKTGSKSNSVDKQEERRRKANEEDGKKKREEALRQQTEEKKRKREEKELKNKLAREAKERFEMEKRQKAEKEREEKARLVQQQIDKQREEMEKKRLLQIQRMQEKEEKRRLEEQQRQLRLREQEEAERGLAEQRRREQEAERRKEAEARAQQQAAAEAMRLKQQILAAQAKQHAQNKKHEGPTNYILDSEPDDDESDDESRPKHAIPYWSQSHVRKCQLEMQRYIPMNAICKFFDAKKSTPDLTEFFHGIDRNRLKRTSSAIWKTPPRYSMME